MSTSHSRVLNLPCLSELLAPPRSARTGASGLRGRRGRGRRCRGGGSGLRLSLFRRGSFLGGNFFDKGGGALLANEAGGIIDAALRQGELAAAGAGFRVEFVQGCFALLGRKSAHIHAGQDFGAVGVFQEDVAVVLEGLYFRGDR